jgi:hypothetical protein
MSDSREAYVKWRQDRGIRIGDDPIPATEFWDAAWQAAQAQAQAGDGEAVGYIVPISGEYRFFKSYDDALDERKSEEYWDKDLDHVKPQAVYLHRQPQVNQQLLEALEAVLECGSTTDQWWVDQARAAIAAAQEQGK